MNVTDIADLAQVYDYQMRFCAPYFFPADLESWKQSFEEDMDGAGRQLFRKLYGKAAYDGDVLVGFVQYGYTTFGFDASGEISADVSYPVIRALYFDQDRADAGQMLLQEALEALEAEESIYAFFHYFGMSCFARHGKLFEQFHWIEALLAASGLTIEHENVYYSAPLTNDAHSDVQIVAHASTVGRQQTLDFILDHRQIGCCEIHDLDLNRTVYLRWIYVDDTLQNQGVGSKCMSALKRWLYDQGMVRLDTDTALDNHRAQRYYEKNGFTRAGITRSFYLHK